MTNTTQLIDEKPTKVHDWKEINRIFSLPFAERALISMRAFVEHKCMKDNV